MLVTIPRDDLDDLLPIMLGGRRSVILVGPPGTGKTTLAASTALRMAKPLYKVAAHPDATYGEMVMSAMPYGGAWQTVANAVLRAFGYNVDSTGRLVRVDDGGLLLLDDIHQAGPGMVSTMYTCLDYAAGARVTLPDGGAATPGDAYACVATMNGSADDLDPAVRDRAIAVVPVLSPPTAAFDTLHPLVRVPAALDYNGRNPNPVATFREWQSVSELWPRFGAFYGQTDPCGLSYACTAALGDGTHAHRMLEALATVDTNVFSGQYQAAASLAWHVAQ